MKISNPRRQFLRLTARSVAASAAASIMPALIRDALATPAEKTTGTIDDIQHIVIFMQENRAFDHYYGTLRGVRGFNDRMAITLPSGKPVWMQPYPANQAGYILPFHLDSTTTRAMCVDAPAMNYAIDVALWNQGRYDAWNTARPPRLGMGYFARSDLSFYYALADAFTICDQYYASVMTQTNPNRLHVFSGSDGLSVGQPATLNNLEPTPGFSWPTFAETLEAAHINWKVYQEPDNFDDNALAWFQNFKVAPVGSSLHRKGLSTVPDIVQAFTADVASGNLPQVSWIIAPTPLSEHANYPPVDGEDLTARLLAGLVANPQVWSKTVFLLNYDEQGGFFDHDPPPTPPGSATEGRATMTTTGEVDAGQPIGLGFRVPMMVISPWSKGGYVCSQVFDHTSMIQFIEKRFGVHCPNISAWRRSVCGDLTSAFDFRQPDAHWPGLPDTGGYAAAADRQCGSLPTPIIPASQSMPRQEPGTRPSRALPYEFHATGRVDPTDGAFWLTIVNSGAQGAAFAVYDLATPANPPRRYAVDPDREVTDSWRGSMLTGRRYTLALRGANGFLRLFAGEVAATAATPAANPEIGVRYDVANDAIRLTLTNTGSRPCTFTLTSNAYRKDGPWTFSVAPGRVMETNWSLADSGNWYDFSATVDAQPAFLRRFAGRLENGNDLLSDPAAA
ncbi:phosphocholine-specific phospholipase C [Paraburkholderia bryophila]|nr:phospholipase C, phosphocholine-specific [Paraburkholderia bryophila]